jgi:hypothetical protein
MKQNTDKQEAESVVAQESNEKPKNTGKKANGSDLKVKESNEPLVAEDAHRIADDGPVDAPVLENQNKKKSKSKKIQDENFDPNDHLPGELPEPKP